ncbi:hypothetical protein [Streptomyces atratus]|nr:hypothetical protein [Streptomyces atratus]
MTWRQKMNFGIAVTNVPLPSTMILMPFCPSRPTSMSSQACSM